jgi:hypothetical protein
MLALRKLGNSKSDDRTLINTSLGSTGTVSLVSKGTLQQATFLNTHTYAFAGQGDSEDGNNARRTNPNTCFQGLIGTEFEGSQTSQIVFNAANIISTLTGHTILSATLTGTNASAYYTSGAKAMVGWTKVIPGGATWNAQGSWTSVDVMDQLFLPSSSGTPLTFSIPVSLVQAFLTGSATALALGDGVTNHLVYAGTWNGGPNSWTLTVNYV